MIKYLITGTGRCGTGYAAKLLTSAGVPCGHEAVFSHGGLEEAQKRAENVVAESSWLAAPYLDNPLLKDAIIVHLVRHPKHVIESMLRLHFLDDEPPEKVAKHTQFALRTVPGIKRYATPAQRAAALYVAWNELIERKAHGRILQRFRVEDAAAVLLEALGINPTERDLYSNYRYNTSGVEYVDFDIDELPAELRVPLAAMCDRYGYDLHSPPLPPPHVYWSVLFERTVHNHAVSALLDVAMVAGMHGYTRIGTLYARTDAARNLIVRSFRVLSRNPNDTLVMLDCDHKHPPDIIARLVARNEGVVGALAFRRSPPFEPMFFKRHEDGRLLKPGVFEPVVYECDAMGTAAIAVKRWVFDRLQEAGHNYFFRYEYGEHDWRSSEDMWFCRLCEDVGIHMYCDCSLETPHLRMEAVDGSVWEKYRSEHPELLKELSTGG